MSSTASHPNQASQQLPSGLEHVRTTPRFTIDNMPAGLLREHRLATDVWGCLRVDVGALTLVFDDDTTERVTIHAGGTAVIPPTRPHHVELDPSAIFSIDIHRSVGDDRGEPTLPVSVRSEALERLTGSVVAEGHAPGVAIAVVGPGDRLVCAAAGDARAGRAMTADTACNWFSMTKIATATTAVLLADRGVLDLDAPVADWLGDVWPDAFRTVTMRHLLSHSAGLRNPLPLRWVHAAGSPTPDQRTFLATLMRRQNRPRYPPGTRAAYSNVGYLAAGEVLAQVTGHPVEEVIAHELLVPLGMQRTAFRWDDLHEVPRATGHHPAHTGLTFALSLLLPDGLVGTRQGRSYPIEPFELDGRAYGGLIGSTLDAAKLLTLHTCHGIVHDRRLASRESITEMSTIVQRRGKRQFGLGWFREADERTRAVEQFGGGIGFFNVMRLHPGCKVGAVVMSNTTRRWDIASFADQAIAATSDDPAELTATGC